MISLVLHPIAAIGRRLLTSREAAAYTAIVNLLLQLGEAEMASALLSGMPIRACEKLIVKWWARWYMGGPYEPGAATFGRVIVVRSDQFPPRIAERDFLALLSHEVGHLLHGRSERKASSDERRVMEKYDEAARLIGSTAAFAPPRHPEQWPIAESEVKYN